MSDDNIPRKRSGKDGVVHSIYEWSKTTWKNHISWIRSSLPPFILFGLLLLVMFCFMGGNISRVITYLDSVSVITGTFTTILAVTTWFSLQRLRKNAAGTISSAGEDAAIVIIDIGMNIYQNVMIYCNSKKEFAQVLNGEGFLEPKLFEAINGNTGLSGFVIEQIHPGQRVLHVSRPNNIDGTELPFLGTYLYTVLNTVDRALRENGIGTIHLFYGGMAVVPFYIGELFGNRYDVHIYHWQKSKKEDGGTTYVYCGQMNHLLYK